MKDSKACTGCGEIAPICYCDIAVKETKVTVEQMITLRKYVKILMKQVFQNKGINDFTWKECFGSNELYFRIGYYDKFFLEDGLEDIFTEYKDFDPDCGPMYSYYLKETQ